MTAPRHCAPIARTMTPPEPTNALATALTGTMVRAMPTGRQPFDGTVRLLRRGLEQVLRSLLPRRVAVAANVELPA